MYSLKISARIVTPNNKFDIFEKRIDLTQSLQNPGTHPLNSQIKANETNGCAKNIQIQLKLKNSSEPKRKKKKILEMARSVNKIDVVSFKKNSSEEIVEKMYMSQHSSHLLEILEEVKESIIYSKEEQYQLFTIVSEYLLFQNDAFIVRVVLEIVNLYLLKFPKAFDRLNKNEAFCRSVY